VCLAGSLSRAYHKPELIQITEFSRIESTRATDAESLAYFQVREVDTERLIYDMKSEKIMCSSSDVKRRQMLRILRMYIDLFCTTTYNA
jgi:hypothetical protein